MPGGVTLNGEMIYNDAVEELKVLMNNSALPGKLHL